MHNLYHNEIAGITYKELYCLQGNRKYKTCKRYQIIEKYGEPAPRGILPNSCINLEVLELRAGLLVEEKIG
jgi:hypothetical protein